MYKSEKGKLKKLFPDGVYEMLKDSGAMVAGGAITSLFTNREVNDVDVYFKSREDMVKAIAWCFGETAINGDAVEFGMACLHKSDKSITFNRGSEGMPNIQFIYFDYFQDVQSIFKCFDFSINMGGYDLESEEFLFHPTFFKHTSQRYLKFNEGTSYPLMSMLRVQKYLDRGYTISKIELVRLLLCCMELDLQSWEDMKTHIGGMYGYDMSELFNEEAPFSIEEAMFQMDNLDVDSDELYFQSDAYDLTFSSILMSLYDPKEYENPDSFKFRADCFYKTTNSEYNSPVAGQRIGSVGRCINYNIGAVVCGSDSHGIYVNANPRYPARYNERHTVELKPIGAFKILNADKNSFLSLSHSGGMQIIGDLEVVRQLEIDYDDTPEQMIINKFFPEET